MTQKLKSFLDKLYTEKAATDNGTTDHKKLEYVVIDDVAGEKGDKDFIEKIKSHPDLKKYFVASAKTEVPIAGYIDGKFVSKRIDRLLINHNDKNIIFIDYKTDHDKTTYIEEYKQQLNSYATLLRGAYPEYKITGYILWTNLGLELEQIV